MSDKLDLEKGLISSNKNKKISFFIKIGKSVGESAKYAFKLFVYSGIWSKVSLVSRLRLSSIYMVNAIFSLVKPISAMMLGRAMESIALRESKLEFLGISSSPISMLYASVILACTDFFQGYIKRWILYGIIEGIYSKAVNEIIRLANSHFYDTYSKEFCEFQLPILDVMNSYPSMESMSTDNIQPQIFNLFVGTATTLFLENSILSAFVFANIIGSWAINELMLFFANPDRLNKEKKEKLDKFSKQLFDSFDYSQVARSYGRADFELKLIEKYLNEYVIVSKKLILNKSLKVLLALYSTGLSLGYISWATKDGFDAFDINEVTFILTYFVMLHGNFSSLSDSIMHSKFCFKNINKVEELSEKYKESNRPVVVNSTKRGHENKIEVKNLSYRYDSTKPLLEDISIEFKKNKLYVFSGPSGQGKSTFMRILSKLSAPKTGDIFVFSKPLSAMTQSEISKNITFLPQDPKLFEKKPVLYNLLYSFAPDDFLISIVHLATYKEICVAINKSKLLDAIKKKTFIDLCKSKLALCGISELFDKEDCLVSSGERQRLAIAMALLRNSPVIIFDEATANLDPDSAKIVTDLIQGLIDKTRLVITHEPKQFDVEDKIEYVLENHKFKLR